LPWISWTCWFITSILGIIIARLLGGLTGTAHLYSLRPSNHISEALVTLYCPGLRRRCSSEWPCSITRQFVELRRRLVRVADPPGSAFPPFCSCQSSAELLMPFVRQGRAFPVAGPTIWKSVGQCDLCSVSADFSSASENNFCFRLASLKTLALSFIYLSLLHHL